MLYIGSKYLNVLETEVFVATTAALYPPPRPSQFGGIRVPPARVAWRVRQTAFETKNMASASASR